jgi:DNA-binding PadR family transcriptional regulator
MSVRKSLLAILAQGPCYGYQLRAEFDRRTGATWPLNVGQVYTTLDRLERDGLVTQGETDAEGRVNYAITPMGRDEATRWLSEPLARILPERDELATKIALAVTLPGVDAISIIRAQRVRTASALAELRAARETVEGETMAPAAAAALILDARIGAAEAELAWLDRSAERVAVAADEAFGLHETSPKRGRPAKLPAKLPAG